MTTQSDSISAATAPIHGGPRRRDAGTVHLALRNFSMLIALVAIWAFFGIYDATFLSPRNLSNLAVELSITAVVSLGMLLIIVPGQIDLSVGSGVGLFGGLAAVLVFEHNWSSSSAMGVSAVIAVAVWALMGLLIIKEKIPAFIITLAGLLVFQGIHWRVIHTSTIPVTVGGQANLYSLLTTGNVPPLMGYVLAGLIWLVIVFFTLSRRSRRRAFGLLVDDGELTFLKLVVAGQLLFLPTLICNQYHGLPLSFVILAAAAAIIWLLTQHTRFGRHLYAIGGNEEAAVVSGVPVMRTVVTAFAIMGLLVALGGFMQTAYGGASTTTVGRYLELDAIAACVIGGTSLKGGRGTVLGVLFGSLIMASLLNGMNIMGSRIDPADRLVARGVVLALAVWMDVRLSRRG